VWVPYGRRSVSKIWQKSGAYIFRLLQRIPTHRAWFATSLHYIQFAEGDVQQGWHRAISVRFEKRRYDWVNVLFCYLRPRSSRPGRSRFAAQFASLSYDDRLT
jgi:hypothetical protein